jgi:hypothetical protein
MGVSQQQPSAVTAGAVDAAGAVMTTDTSLAGYSWFLDEDAMTSNSATKTSSQQAIKAYVDAQVIAGADLTKVTDGKYYISDTAAAGNADQVGGGTDDTVAIQGLLTTVAALSGHHRVIFEANTYYKISSTLVVGANTSLDSEAATPLTYPRLIWNGSAGGTMMEIATLGASIYTRIRRLNLQGHNDGTLQPGICIDWLGRLDRFGGPQDVGTTNFTIAGHRFRRGGINTVLHGLTADDFLGAHVYWDVYSNQSDNFIWRESTTDNSSGTGVAGGGKALVIDASAATNTSKTTFTLDTLNWEVQTALTTAATEGMLLLIPPSATNSTRVNFIGNLRHVYVNGSASTTNASIRCQPASDDTVLTIQTCLLPGGIYGIPSLRNIETLTGSAKAGHFPLAVAAGRHVQRDDGSVVNATVEFGAGVNFMGPVTVEGMPAMLMITVPTSQIPAGTTIYEGQVFFDATGLSGTTSTLALVFASNTGTEGTLAGITATTTNGSPNVTLNSTTGVYENQYITIAGVAGSHRIEVVNRTTNVITLGGNLFTVVGPGAAVAFHPVNWDTYTLAATPAWS